MAYSILLLAVAAGAQAHWVPLSSSQAKQAQGQIPSSAPGNATAPLAGTQPQPVPSNAAAQVNQAVRFLPAGTMVSLTPLEELSSKHMREGQQFQFIVVNDVVDNGVVVIPRGSTATGTVTMQTGRAIGGKSGKFDITFDSVSANGVLFPLSGVHRQEGKGNTLGALFGSIWITGRSAVMQPGEVLTAFTKQRTAY